MSIRILNGFMKHMASRIKIAVINSNNPFVEVYCGGGTGVERIISQLDDLISEVTRHPDSDVSPSILEQFLYSWGHSDKFLKLTVGENCEYFREKYYSAMRATIHGA